MQIGKYSLEFTSAIQAEFVNQNESRLIEDIKYYIDTGSDHRYACQQLADRIYDDCRISIDVGLLYKLDVLGE